MSRLLEVVNAVLEFPANNTPLHPGALILTELKEAAGEAEAKRQQLLTTLEDAESFLSGFEDCDREEDRPAMLPAVRAAIALLRFTDAPRAADYREVLAANDAVEFTAAVARLPLVLDRDTGPYQLGLLKGTARRIEAAETAGS
jgi:hypothetical protein